MEAFFQETIVTCLKAVVSEDGTLMNFLTIMSGSTVAVVWARTISVHRHTDEKGLLDIRIVLSRPIQINSI